MKRFLRSAYEVAGAVIGLILIGLVVCAIAFGCKS